MVLILQWLAHRHTASIDTVTSQDESPSAKSAATATRSKTALKREEVVDNVADTIRMTVEGGNGPPLPPLADIELVVGVIRTFCW